jgi:thymidylate synthase (FAD)
MHDVEPEVFLIARPAIAWDALAQYLAAVGGEKWLQRVKAAGGPEGEQLAEFMGRLCYRSWSPGLNPNVTKVREDSDEYFANILRSAHGSVLEHASYSFVFLNVSRVFTHELVRHRAGTAVSQESMRYVRLTDLPFEHPEYVRSDPELLKAAEELISSMERFQDLSVRATNLPESDFHTKKTITSAARRYSPQGVATSVGWTANIRALRHIVAARTDPGAEEEIRRVFARVGEIMRIELPALFRDFSVDASGAWIPEFPKV